MRITEILTEIAASNFWIWSYTSDQKAQARFKIGNIDYIFEAINSQNDHEDNEMDRIDYDDEYDNGDASKYEGYWLVEFRALAINGKTLSPEQGISMLNTGNSAQVIAIISEIIQEFVTKYRNSIRVIEYDTQNNRGRRNVYSRIFKRLLPNWQQREGEIHDVEVVRP